MKNFIGPFLSILLLTLSACGGGSSGTSAPASLPSGLLPTATTPTTVVVTTTPIAGAIDTSAPSAPGTLAVNGATSDSISFSWLASTDDAGVVGYEIWRNGQRIQLTPASQTTFNDGTLAANTSYSYSVRALDAAGNASTFSFELVVRTQPASTLADTSAPSTPSGLTAGQATASSLAFSWSPSTDNQGVARYEIYRGGTLVASTAQTSYVLTGLTASTQYTLTIKAFDAAGNASGTSATLVLTTAAATVTSTPDATAPSAPTALAVTQTTTSSLNLNWTASTDNVGVVGYSVLRNGTVVGTSSTPGFLLTGLAASTTYSLTVKAFDAAGNTSATSTALSATTASTTPPADTTPPSAPGNLAVSNTTSTSLTLSWSASTDNVGVVRYDVYRGATLAGAVTATSLTLSGLSPSTSYALTVKAVDAAGNNSAASATLNASTSAAADTTPPSAPGNPVVSNPTSSSLTLGWTASTDNVGVVRYDIYSGTTLAGNTTGTSYTLSGLAASTSYTLSVKAVDAAGNVSAASAGAVGTTAAVSGASSPSSRQTQQTLTTTNSSGGTTRMRYLRYLPADYATTSTNYPVLIFLHGSGEQSQNDGSSADATEFNRIAVNGPPKHINANHDMCFTRNGTQSCFIVLSPQSPQVDGWWNPDRVVQLLDYAKTNLRVDTSRIYLTGLSMGGGATWATARTNRWAPLRYLAAEFAAIVPIAGADTVSSAACNMANQALPVWAFHGTADGTVSPDRSREFVNALNGQSAGGVQCSANPVKALLTEYAGVGHDSWSTTYNPANRFNPTTAVADPAGFNIYEWMLGYDRPLVAGATTRALSAGTYHSLGVISGLPKAWGSGRAGETGITVNPQTNYLTPQEVALTDELVSVSAGGYQSLGLNKGGRVWSFGAHEAGQRGDGSAVTDTNGNVVPVRLSGLHRIVSISSGGRHNMALSAEGVVWAWGANDNGQLGQGGTTQTGFCGGAYGSTPSQYHVRQPLQVTFPGNVKIRQISAGYCSSFALDENGEVWSWGYGAYQSAILGQGVKSGEVYSTPAKVSGLTNVTAISAGDSCAFALRSDNTLWGWGRNVTACVGDGTQTIRPAPVQILTSVRSVNARAQGGFATKLDGSLWSWGESMYGSVGNGTIVTKAFLNSSDEVYIATPVRISNWSDVRSVHSGSSSNHVFVVRNDGTVWTWGRNKSGNLGNGLIGDADNTNATPDDQNVGTPIQVNLPP